MRHLYYCRHGESTSNLAQKYAGQTDVPLTDYGRQQARLAGVSVVALKIDAIVASPLVRALETAWIIADAIGFDRDKIIIDGIFQERSLGNLEGLSYDAGDEDEASNDTIETMERLIERATKGLGVLKALDAGNVLLVSHGSFGKALQTVLDPSRPYGEPPNAQIIKLV